ncbi:hypothetical protein KI387_040370, partial [Taxus chinensis]
MTLLVCLFPCKKSNLNSELLFKDNLFKESSISKEKMKEIYSLQSSIEEANKDYHTRVEFDNEMEKCFGFWAQSTANTSVPRGRDIAEALKRFK